MDPLYKEIIIVLTSIFVGLSIVGFMATRHYLPPQPHGQEDDDIDDEMCIALDHHALSATAKEPSEWQVVVEKIEALEDRLARLENQKKTRKIWGLVLTILLPVIAIGAPYLYISLMISQKLPQ
jgi:hypothetical protein